MTHDERTPVDTHRQAILDILNARADVRHAVGLVNVACENAIRTLTRTASLDAEHFDLNPSHASAPVVAHDAPTVQDTATLPKVAAREEHTNAAKVAIDKELSTLANTWDLDDLQPCGTVRILDCACFDCRSAPVCKHVNDATVAAYDSKHSRQAPTGYKAPTVTHTQSTPAPTGTPTHAATFANVQRTAPNATIATMPVPAARPYAGVDAMAQVYDATMASLCRTGVNVARAHAERNTRIDTSTTGIVRISVNLANVQTVPAYIGQSDKTWGLYVATTIVANPRQNARRRRITYAQMEGMDSLDFAFYLAIPERKANANTTFAMPNAPHLAMNADAATLGQQVDAGDNWSLAVVNDCLIVSFALPTYANIVAVKRTPTWGSSIATTRHAGSRRIIKTVKLGASLVLLLDVVQRVTARRQ
ncbi:hypothetical protein LCGC14_0275810 [marine sediment metagenome]|uniref:SWIM-type domain-containing protein n=1 Tax=marine sediment metagenome TaxID=412755 RepID=A0A0F9U2K9_9ZZZZ